MEIRLTKEMLAAVKETPELPDNLRTRVSDAKAAGDLTEQGRLFDDIIQAIIDADLRTEGRTDGMADGR